MRCPHPIATDSQIGTQILEQGQQGETRPSLLTEGFLDDMAGSLILRVRAVRTLDGKGWAEIEFKLDNGRRVRIIANGKSENLSFVFWISGASWWKPWTWFSGHWKGLRPSDFAW